MQFVAQDPDPGRPLLFNPVAYNGLHLAVIYRLGQPPRRLYIRLASYEDMVGHVAALLHLDEMQIVALREVEAFLQGEVEGAHSMIAQCVGDLTMGSSGQLHLLDVEHHQDGATIRPPRADRSVVTFALHVTRLGILRYAGVEQYCDLRDQRCLVYVNNVLWPLQDVRVRALHHRQYFRIVLPPPGQQATHCGKTVIRAGGL